MRELTSAARSSGASETVVKRLILLVGADEPAADSLCGERIS
jgi:hypothetical protein